MFCCFYPSDRINMPGTFLPFVGVIVDWMSALVNLDIRYLEHVFWFASTRSDSMYLVFICALNLYSLNNSRTVSAYMKFSLNSGAGETTGGTVEDIKPFSFRP